MSAAVAAAAAAVVTGASSSSSARKTQKPTLLPLTQVSSLLKAASSSAKPGKRKSAFYGAPFLDGKRISSVAEIRKSGERSGAGAPKKGLEVNARTAGAAKTIEVEVDKPLGLTLGQKPGGRVVITAVDGGGNAAKAGLKSGDQVLYTSSFFGDELWPADKLGFTKTAIQAKPDSVYFVVSRGAEVDVKRLTKRPAPPRFGRSLTEAQKARATHICLDCGFIYFLPKPFEEQATMGILHVLLPFNFQDGSSDSYTCPQCSAPKKRFARYDVATGKPIGGSLPIGVIIGLVAGIAGVGALLVYGLQ
ncbi:hypothetical protein Taro_046710 [Colocasia esculenta]|uniref:Rubredoxin family protein n=1 Tax=Colocasia esculenta TaxID=4460 RepID=A0A843X6G7_COLES|nr:hypothetical protein [Colocasia esculenta]